MKQEILETLIKALQQIAQMSDCGSAELTIIRMKEIAANALKNQQ